MDVDRGGNGGLLRLAGQQAANCNGGMMQTKTLMIGAAVAVGVFLLMRKNNSVLGWWQGLAGIKPGSQQAALLMQQERDFYGLGTGYTNSPY